MDKLSEIKKICEEKQIRMIDFKMTDIDGRWRHITISFHHARHDGTALFGMAFDIGLRTGGGIFFFIYQDGSRKRQLCIQ